MSFANVPLGPQVIQEVHGCVYLLLKEGRTYIASVIINRTFRILTDQSKDSGLNLTRTKHKQCWKAKYRK